MQTGVSANPIEQNQSPSFSHVPDFYNRYPGEEARFFTSLVLEKCLPGAVLSVALPPGLELIEHTVAEPEAAHTTFVRDLTAGQVVDLHLGSDMTPGTRLEIVTRTRVANPGKEVYLVSVAELRDSRGELVCSESTRIAVRTAGSYMNHLPEIYHGNDFMGRFLMLFESFWKPISQQIDQVDVYFDPKLTPSGFLPWLASWLGVTWDDSLPEERKRKLLEVAISLYQRRGTRGALEDYLRIYTGGEVEIIEHRAQNFVLGPETRLGAAVALGRQNLPHTFSVNVEVDPLEIERMDARDEARNESAYRQKLEAIIELRKPAHTAFRLNLTVGNSKEANRKYTAKRGRTLNEQ
jgi:phage tail-like protein